MINKIVSFGKLSEFKNAVKTSKRLLTLLWYIDKWLFLGDLLVVSIPAIIPFVNAYIYKLIIDLIVKGVNNNAPFNFQTLYFLIFLRLLTLLVQDIAYSAQTYIDQLLWNKIPGHMYQLVLTKLANLDIQRFEDSVFRDKLEKVRDAYLWRPLNMTSSLFYGFQNIVQAVIAFVALATLNWVFLIIILLITIPSFITQTKYEKIVWGIWQDETGRRKKFYYIADLIQWGQSIKEIKLFEMAPKFLSELKTLYADFSEKNIKAARNQLKANTLLNVFGVIMYIGIELFIILQALAKRISIGDITYYTTVIGNFQGGINGLFRNTTQVFTQSLYVQEIFEVLDLESKIIQPEKPIKIDARKTPRIEFRNVSFAYPGTNQKVLKNFSLTINPGQKIAFVGENGAGKTTIVKLLARFYDVDGGEILIDGINLKQLDISSWYKIIGVLFQDFIRYEYPLEDNIYFGKVYEDKNMQEIINAAKLAGADQLAKELPKKYDQMLGRTFEGGIELSAGQWQKVALARAFLRNAPVLILDEPTASIDAKAESEIFDRVEKLSSDKTVIIISHRFSTVRNADEIHVIEKGKIIESGNHEELMEKDGTYTTLFNLQAKRYQ